ncbi:MAG: imidazole glycerol phosphate synthase subunit HisF [Bacteroidales bacterium]|nr:imidazole glycerol phosphate synthase subunit HisF [Bacteroidales bacterium]
MLAKRIIPCLDIRNGQTVKGVNFVDIREVGDPVELGAKYAREGADELVYLDITASFEERKLFTDLVKRIALHLNIPFTVGGGINELADADRLLSAGADKVSINTSAVLKPDFITELAEKYGSQFVVCAVDAKLESDGKWWVYINGGRKKMDKELYSWLREVQERGAGEILFTSMNHDGTKNGYANEPLSKLSEMLSIPIIASGGAGEKEHFVDVFTKGKADAALAASIFHFNEIPIQELKDYLKKNKISIR